MEITTKYNIGDKVWVLQTQSPANLINSNKEEMVKTFTEVAGYWTVKIPVEVKVKKLFCEISQYGVENIHYAVSLNDILFGPILREVELFSSLEECLIEKDEKIL
jgi:hypothetical protein